MTDPTTLAYKPRRPHPHVQLCFSAWSVCRQSH